MINKGTKLYSIRYFKCPQCHNGDLFKTGTYDLKHFTEMPEQCECCGQRFVPEPSFYSGAMYVSYALQVALFTTVYVALRILFNPGTDVYIYVTISAAMLLVPVTFRLSRSIYINFFIDFDKYCSCGRK
jgi:uncharacterized protein (DUF983 family)